MYLFTDIDSTSKMHPETAMTSGEVAFWQWKEKINSRQHGAQ